MPQSIRHTHISNENKLYVGLQSSLFLAKQEPVAQGLYLNFLNTLTAGKYLHQIISTSREGIDDSEYLSLLEDAESIDVLNVEQLPPTPLYTRYEVLASKDSGIIQNTYRLNVNLQTATFSELIGILNLAHVLATNLKEYKRPANVQVTDYLARIAHKSTNRY